MTRGFAILFLFCTSFLAGTAQQFDPKFTEAIAKSESKKYTDISFDYDEEIDLIYARLSVSVDPRKQFIEGNVTFTFKPLVNDANTISFDAHDSLEILNVFHRGNTVNFTHQKHLLKAELTPTVKAYEVDSITIHYRGTPPKGERAGFVTTERSVPGDFSLFTLSQPYGAREWWPVRQALGDRLASIEVSITVPSQFKGISNGLIQRQFTEDSLTTTVWKHSYSIPPYLVAIAAADYAYFQDSIHINNDTLLYENYLFRDQIDQIEQFDQLKDMMRLFEELAIDYPFSDEKYGHTMWERGGGMEHTTNSFMGNFSWELQAHELAHMWFGDLVTCESWQDIWLNEGFASYFTGLTYDFIPKVRKYWPLWKRTRLDAITSKPGGSVYVYDTSEVSRVFDFRLSYRKAAYVLHMIRWEMGDRDFFRMISRWLREPMRDFNFASTEDFMSHIGMYSSFDVNEFFNDWIYKEGFPSYQLFWEQKDGSFSGELFQTTSHPSVDFFEMTVPIRVYSANNDSADVLLKHTSSGQRLNEPIGFKIDSVAIDPDLWLISANSQVRPMREKNNLSVYPNPAQGYVNLEYPGPEGTIFNIQITNLNGQIVEQIDNLSLSFFQLDVSALPTGSYQLIVTTGYGRFEEKIVIY